MKKRCHLNGELEHSLLSTHVEREGGAASVVIRLGRCTLNLGVATCPLKTCQGKKGTLWKRTLIRDFSR